MNGPFKIGEIRPIEYFLAIGVIIGLLFSMIADGDESVSAIIPQIIQWQLQVLIPLFILIAVHSLLHKIDRFDNLNPWLKLSISGLIGALLFSPLAIWIDWMYGEVNPSALSSGLLHEFISVAPPVILCWIAINAPWLLGFQLVRKNVALKIESTSQASQISHKEPSFYELLPENIRGELIYLKAELHYLKVVTTAGSALILYNLKDAISQLRIDGIKTHRSYWVASKYLGRVEKIGRQGQVHTITKDIIPISRNQLSMVIKKHSKTTNQLK